MVCSVSKRNIPLTGGILFLVVANAGKRHIPLNVTQIFTPCRLWDRYDRQYVHFFIVTESCPERHLAWVILA